MEYAFNIENSGPSLELNYIIIILFFVCLFVLNALLALLRYT